MKKYLFAALALTALVACSKDPVDEVLTSSQKSVTISIANMASGTRATAGDTTGVISGNAESIASTTLDENFYIMFLDNGNTIRSVYTGNVITSDADQYGGTSGIYTFHALQDVTKVVAVGNLKGGLTPPTVGASFDTLLSAWQTATKNMINAEYKNLVVFSTIETLTASKTDGVQDMVTDPSSLKEYPKYTASIEVKPIMSRIEVTQIHCDEFGAANIGYEKIRIIDMQLSGQDSNDDGTPDAEAIGAPYTHAFGAFNEATAFDTYTLSSGSPTLKPTTDGHVWSWNIVPQNISNLVTNVYVKGNNYTTIAPNRTLTIVGYNGGAITQFEAGKIYKIAIDFEYTNLDPANNIISAYVEVEIADWEVVATTPTFKTN